MEKELFETYGDIKILFTGTGFKVEQKFLW
jgi:hypothetical protein